MTRRPANPRPTDPPDLDWPEFDPAVHCHRCSGCRYIASSDEGEAWTAWSSLPPGSDLAVQLGLVSPLPCPDCRRTGLRPPEDVARSVAAKTVLELADERPAWGISADGHQHFGSLDGLHGDVPALAAHLVRSHDRPAELTDPAAWHAAAHGAASTVAAVPDVVAPEVLVELSRGIRGVAGEALVPQVFRGDGGLGLTAVMGLPVEVDARLDPDVLEVRHPDGSVAARIRVPAGTSAAARAGMVAGLSIAGSVDDVEPSFLDEQIRRAAGAVWRDQEAWAAEAIDLARSAGAELVGPLPPDGRFARPGSARAEAIMDVVDVALGGDVVDAQIMCGELHPRSGVSCSRPDGHGLPHVHFDSSSEAAGSPVVQWRSVTE